MFSIVNTQTLEAVKQTESFEEALRIKNRFNLESASTESHNLIFGEYIIRSEEYGLTFVDGFAQAAFIGYVEAKNHLIDGNSYELLRRICEYGRTNHGSTPGGMVTFLVELIPHLDSREAAAFFTDECLTEEGKAAKHSFWEAQEATAAGE